MDATQDREPDVSRKTVPVTNELMATKGVFIDTAVMIHSSCREGRMSHNTARRADDGRWYIRKGKRGGIVRYLTECEITYLNGVPTLHQFKTNYLESVRQFEARMAARRADASVERNA